jgi:LuxR family maltose regulon positive regulatory protein
MKEHALIRYYISINDITTAKKILTSFMKHLDIKEQALYHLSSLLLFCNILVIEEDIDEALVFLRKAINIGSSDLFLRSFLDEERSLSSLIYELRKKDDLSEPEKEFLELIISNFVVSIENKYLETKLIDPLSRREMDVIELIAKGLQNKEIGNQLFISTGTVKTHIVKIYSKLDVRNRTEAINKAKDLEIII